MCEKGGRSFKIKLGGNCSTNSAASTPFGENVTLVEDVWCSLCGSLCPRWSPLSPSIPYGRVLSGDGICFSHPLETGLHNSLINGMGQKQYSEISEACAWEALQLPFGSFGSIFLATLSYHVRSTSQGHDSWKVQVAWRGSGGTTRGEPSSNEALGIWMKSHHRSLNLQLTHNDATKIWDEPPSQAPPAKLWESTFVLSH